MDGAIWAVLVASKQAAPSPDATSPQGRDAEVQGLLERARSVASSPETICAIIAEELNADWSALARRILPENLFSQRRGAATQAAIASSLNDIGQRDTKANVVLIPSDHCSAEKNAWVICAKNAIRLGVTRARTVIVLHDKPQNDPRTSRHYPGVCSSSVMIGSILSLQDLCNGSRAMSIIDMGLDDADLSPQTHQPAPLLSPLRVVHITSVEEYARLQRGEYGRQPSQIDLHA